MSHVTDGGIPTFEVTVRPFLGVHAGSMSFGGSAFRYPARIAKGSGSLSGREALSLGRRWAYRSGIQGQSRLCEWHCVHSEATTCQVN